MKIESFFVRFSIFDFFFVFLLFFDVWTAKSSKLMNNRSTNVLVDYSNGNCVWMNEWMNVNECLYENFEMISHWKISWKPCWAELYALLSRFFLHNVSISISMKKRFIFSVSFLFFSVSSAWFYWNFKKFIHYCSRLFFRFSNVFFLNFFCVSVSLSPLFE